MYIRIDVEEEEEEKEAKFNLLKFKRVDIVEGSAFHDSLEDHALYVNGYTKFGNSYRTCKALVEEWNVLESKLPYSIYARGYKERADLYRAMFVGSSGTPYHHGLFFFDLQLPADYPSSPPLVSYKYHLSSFRLNPNLNPWSPGSHKLLTDPMLLGSLLCIQDRILKLPNFDNIPKQDSENYNYRAFLASCETMLRVIQNPPKHFEDFVVQHFRENREFIMRACKAY